MEGEGWERNKEIQKGEQLSMEPFTHRATGQSVVFINDIVLTLTGAGGELDTELKKA